MFRVFITLILFSSVFYFSPVSARSIHKCVQPGGAISYQESPCVEEGDSMLEQKGVEDQASFQDSLKVLEAQMGEIQVSIPAFEWWRVFRKEHSEDFLHIKLRDDEGDTPISLLIDVMRPQSPDVLNEAMIRDLVKERHSYYGPTSTEQHFNPQKIKLDDGFGMYQRYTDKNLLGVKNYPPGEYLYTTAGFLVRDGLLIKFTLLSNNYMAQNHGYAFVFLTRGMTIERGVPAEDTQNLTAYQSGLAAFVEGKLLDSVMLLEQATIEQPGDSDVWMAYCLALGEVKRLQSAMIACDRAYALNPKEPAYEKHNLSLMISARLFDQAIEQAEKLLRIQPEEDISDLLMELTQRASLLGQLSVSGKALELWATAGQKSTAYFLELAHYLYLSGKQEQALEVLSGISETDPVLIEVVNNFTHQISEHQSVYPSHAAEYSYIELPKRFHQFGQGLLKDASPDQWVTHRIPLMGVGELVVELPEQWVASVQRQQQGEQSNQMTVVVRGLEDITELLTIDVGKVGQDWSDGQLQQRLIQLIRVQSDEPRIVLQPLAAKARGFTYVHQYQRDSIPVRNRYLSSVDGVIALDLHSIDVNVDAESKVLLDRIFDSVSIAEKDLTPLKPLAEVSASADPGTQVTQRVPANDMELPEPDDGFSWQRMPEIMAAVQKPDGWHVHKGETDDGVTYAISKEKVNDGGTFETGFTLIGISNLSSKSGIKPSLFVQHMVEGLSTHEHHQLIRKTALKQGLFRGALIRYENNEPGEKTIIVHQVLAANDTTGSLYMAIFEAPKAEWTEAWKLGEVMLKKYILDDEF